MRVIGDWIQFYNHRRPHQELNMKTSAEAYALAVWPVQKPLDHYVMQAWADYLEALRAGAEVAPVRKAS